GRAAEHIIADAKIGGYLEQKRVSRWESDANYAGRLEARARRRSESEGFAQVNPAHVRISQHRLGCALRQHTAGVENVGAVADAQGFADIVVGDQHANAA